MKHYELVLINRPTLLEGTINSVVDSVKNFVTSNHGVIGRIENWGLKLLAYPIMKNKNGYYCLINFSLNSEHLPELDRKLSLDENVMRYMIFTQSQLETASSIMVENMEKAATQNYKNSR